MKNQFFPIRYGGLLVLFCVLALGARAQKKVSTDTLEMPGDSLREVRATVKITTRFRGDSMVLRWAPDRPGAWQWGNRTGWHIERTTIGADKSFDPATFRRITGSPVRLAPAERWAKVPDLAETNRYVAVAAQCALGPSSTRDGDIISKSDEAASRFGFALLAADLSATAADLLGVRWVDRNIAPNQQYIYKIYPAAPTPGYPMDTAYALAGTFAENTAAPVAVSKVDIGDRQVHFYWSRSAFQALYSAYWIERSDAPGAAYRRLNTLPFVPMLSSTIENPSDWIVFSDTTLENYRKYQYRITGITPFGDEGQPSMPVEVVGRDRTPPPAPVQVKTRHLGGTRVEITWAMPEATEPYQLYVGRTDKYNFSAEALHEQPLPAPTRLFVDEHASLMAPNYYVVSAVDTAGNAAFSLIEYGDIRDTFPPAPPSGLHATCDTNGLVRISWRPAPEPDVKGYLLFFSNAADHAFGTLSNQFIQDTFFLDTMNLLVLTEERFFRLKAIDWHDNYSDFSDTFRLQLPDIVPPVPPLFSDYKVSRQGIYVQWIPSSSHDVVLHQLLRKKTDQSSWEPIGIISDPMVRTWLDTSVQANQYYQYTLRARDDAGNWSEEAFALRIKMLDWAQRPAVKQLSALRNKENNRVELQWNFQVSGDYKFVVYRAEGTGPFQTLAALPGKQRSYLDPHIQAGKTYQYAVKTIFPDGKSSPFSEIVSVTE
jgi:uncharacterized protein